MSQPRITPAQLADAQSNDPATRRAIVVYHEGTTTAVLEVAKTDTIGEVKGHALHKAAEILEKLGVEGNPLSERKDIVLFNQNHAPVEFRDDQTVNALCPNQEDHLVAIIPSISVSPNASLFGPLTSPMGDASIRTRDIQDIIATVEKTVSEKFEKWADALKEVNERLAKQMVAWKKEMDQKVDQKVDQKMDQKLAKEMAKEMAKERAARKKEADAAAEEMATVKKNASALEMQVLALQKELDDIKQQAALEYRRARDKAKKTKRNLQSDLKTLKGERDDDISALQSGLKALEGQMDALQSRVKKLEGKNEALLSIQASDSSDISTIARTLRGFKTIPDHTAKELDKIIRRSLLDQAQALLAKAAGLAEESDSLAVVV
ncbi:hypothetical protein BOTBODRAFT_645396 [Botryobasidium botryosum FD-172 SS1]|uniref:Ubiquitin-like domain-containing protein n=1 Tax=Botryobasidium botryosum (strain FD-172 SS1) TaxID=930990 RepID=A0A067M1P1_BOTB1|nr:hypothetical protein BOTBODRAFT_645396 [Botryobasidium botryosum FD-172 SS1]